MKFFYCYQYQSVIKMVFLRGYASSPDMKGRKANKLSLGKLVIYRERMQLSRCPTNAFLDELVG